MMMIGGRLFILMSASPLKFETQKSAKSRGVGALHHSKLLSRSKIHFGMAVHVREERNQLLFEGALISASSPTFVATKYNTIMFASPRLPLISNAAMHIRRLSVNRKNGKQTCGPRSFGEYVTST
jgi:hypothetical protein